LKVTEMELGGGAVDVHDEVAEMSNPPAAASSALRTIRFIESPVIGSPAAITPELSPGCKRVAQQKRGDSASSEIPQTSFGDP
jgi:hypothetical protein